MKHKHNGPWRPTHYLSPEIGTGWVHDEYNRRRQADYLKRWQEENRIEQLSEFERVIVNLTPSRARDRAIFWALVCSPGLLVAGFLVWLWL